MTYSFNLIDRPWIPCIDPGGRVAELSLGEALARAHELSGIQGDSPLETAAIYRLLLAVLHSAMRGPKKLSEWNDLWQGKKGNFDKPWLHNYLEKWRQRFDLFDEEHPFYQMKDERVKPKSVLDILHGMGTANELFEHTTVTYEVVLTPAKAARRLLVGQLFGLGGGCDPSQNLYLSSGTWTKGVIFLVEGQNLFENLMLNFIKYFEDEPVPALGIDIPAWEMENPYLPTRQHPFGYLDYLTWQNRRLFLIPEKGENGETIVQNMFLAPGLALDPKFIHPMKQYFANKNGWNHEEFSEDKSLWRDSHALFRLKTPDENRPPQSFLWLAKLEEKGYLNKNQIYRFMALGMATHRTQAKIYFYRQEHMPLPLAYLVDDDLVGHLADSLTLAEKTWWFALKSASQWMALLIVSPKSDGKKWSEVNRVSKEQAENLAVHWNTERFYWQHLEIPFMRFLEDLPGDNGALQTWKETVCKAAWEAFEQTANQAGTDSSVLKAAVIARGKLGYQLNILFSETKKEATV